MHFQTSRLFADALPFVKVLTSLDFCDCFHYLVTSLPLKKARSSIGAPVVLRATGPLV